MTLEPGSQTMVIRILTNTSRSKGNQARKIGRLIEYNMRNYSHTILQNVLFIERISG